MANQGFRSLVGNIEPPLANQTTVAATAITAMWDAANLSYLAARQVQADQVYKVTAWGVMTTPATAQTVTFTPVFGTTTGGTSLGASASINTNAGALTNVPWLAEFFTHFRTVGTSGTATCSGRFTSQAILGVASSTTQGTVASFGTASTTATTVDTTVASGLLLCATPNIATLTFTTLGVAFESLN